MSEWDKRAPIDDINSNAPQPSLAPASDAPVVDGPPASAGGSHQTSQTAQSDAERDRAIKKIENGDFDLVE